jgi:hypothetical protein
LVWAVAAASAAIFFGTLLALPFLLSRIPADYFLHPPGQPQPGWFAGHPRWETALRAVKNLWGLIFVGAGVLMLVLPGQGLLTILTGLVLLDLPGKRNLEVALLRRRHIYRAVNWLRKQRNRPPLQLPHKRLEVSQSRGA